MENGYLANGKPSSSKIIWIDIMIKLTIKNPSTYVVADA